jgi:hypothetical protein
MYSTTWNDADVQYTSLRPRVQLVSVTVEISGTPHEPHITLSSQHCTYFFDILLTVHLSIILVINQLNAQNLVL